MASESIYRTSACEAEIHALYDHYLNQLGIAYDSTEIPTRFGKTHLLVLGPKSAPPIVLLQGGNTINPVTLRWFRPLACKYRIYAPDSIGHPGKSVPVRVSARGPDYGKWLLDVLDGLELEQSSILGGSYGAGILLNLATQAPDRIDKAVLCIPSGLVSIPLTTMSLMAWGLLRYKTRPSRAQVIDLLKPMFKDDPIDRDVLDISEVVFRCTRIEAEMPRNVTPGDLKDFKSPTLVLAAEHDAFFPANRVVARSLEVFQNLIAAEMMQGAPHYLPSRYYPYLNERIDGFLMSGK